MTYGVYVKTVTGDVRCVVGHAGHEEAVERFYHCRVAMEGGHPVSIKDPDGNPLSSINGRYITEVSLEDETENVKEVERLMADMEKAVR